MLKLSTGRKVFVSLNTTAMVVYGALCILPFVYLLALSLSSKDAAAAGQVILLPVQFTTKSYEFVMNNPEFLASIVVAIKRVFLGVLVNMFMVIITAYPLSKENILLQPYYEKFLCLISVLLGGY